MLLKTETYNIQKSVADYCRNGKETKIKGTRSDRLPHYRRLVFSVVNDSIQSAYPITKKYIDKNIWEEMVYNFFSTHKCETAQIWRMPNEFYQYSLENNFAEKYKIPYLNDLLYFEWLEVELYMMEDIPYPQIEDINIRADKKIAVNPEYKLIKLEYPVHKIKLSELEKNKGDYFLLLFREKESGRIQFIELSVLYAFLLENILSEEKTLTEIYNEILDVFGINDLDLLLKNTTNFLTNLKEKGFVLGTF